MKPTQILMGEHRVIEQVLSVLERMTDRAKEWTFFPEHARDVVEFFRIFEDRCHHGKEEARLFAMLEARGFPSECGSIAVMLHEHERASCHVHSMLELIAPAAGGDQGALRRWSEHACAFIGLLREHIHKEDRYLSMAEQMLNEADQAELGRQFDRLEHEEMGRGVHEHYLKIADELAETYGVPKAAPVMEPGHD